MEEYYSFMESCRLEKPNLGHLHHIIPKCLGGGDEVENLIYLSYENHQKAHLILADTFPIDSKERKDQILSAQLLNSWTKNPDVILSGWSHTEQTKKILSQKIKLSINKQKELGLYKNGFQNRSHTKEWKEKISKLNTKKDYDVIKQIDLDGNTVNTYTSLSDVIEKNPTYHKSAISNVLNGKLKTTKGFTWVYEIKKNCLEPL
jgi:hypothetical protein